MNRRTPVLILAFGLLAQVSAARMAAAQTVSLSPAHAKQWDAGVSVGWLGGDKGDIADRWNSWYDTFATSVDVGRYWTPHIRTEAGFTFTTEGDVYSQQQITVPRQRAPVFFSLEHGFQVRSLNLSAAYQLFENTWIHPFAGGGVQVIAERHRVETPFPPPFGPDGRGPLPLPPTADADETTVSVRPFLSSGAKFYVTEQGFIRTDLAAAFNSRGVTHVSWRIGGGVDF